jgi:anti-anti-sigma regulatory factor
VCCRGGTLRSRAMAIAHPHPAWEHRESDHHEPELIAVVEAAPHDCDDVSKAIDTGATEVIVDLRTAESIGSHILNTLLDARSRLLSRDGHIAVVVSPRIRRLFGLLSLDRRFVLASSRRQALELLGLVDGHPLSPRRFEHSARAA